MTQRAYWQGRTHGRRRLLRGAGMGAAGLAGLTLLACGDSSDKGSTGAGSSGATTPSAVLATQVPSGTQEQVQPGGTLRLSRNADTDTLDMLSSPSQPASIATAY